MKVSWFLLTSALALLACGSPAQSGISEHELLAHRDFRKLVSFLGDAFQGRGSDPLFFESETENSGEVGRGGVVNKFEFSNCAEPGSEQVVVSKVSLKPDPLRLPGNVTASGAATIKTKVDSPLKVVLEVDYKVLGTWIKVPCVDNVGSCTYADFCTMLNVPECPPEIIKAGLTCKCPFPAGEFSVSEATLPINAKLPISGDIKVKAEATMNGVLVTCAEVQLSIA